MLTSPPSEWLTRIRGLCFSFPLISPTSLRNGVSGAEKGVFHSYLGRPAKPVEGLQKILPPGLQSSSGCIVNRIRIVAVSHDATPNKCVCLWQKVSKP
jgi:hypothetical protein